MSVERSGTLIDSTDWLADHFSLTVQVVDESILIFWRNENIHKPSIGIYLQAFEGES